MKKILFIIALMNVIIVQAQTVYHYNMPCGSERYFENDSELLVLKTADSVMVANRFDLEAKPIAGYSGDFMGRSSIYLKCDEGHSTAELVFFGPGKLRFSLMNDEKVVLESYYFEELMTQEMIPFEYLCYTAHRAIYFEGDDGRDSVTMFIQRRYPVPAKSLSKEDSLKFIEAILTPYKGLPNEFRYPVDMVKNADIMMVQDYTSLYEIGEMEPDYSANWEINDDIDVVLNVCGLLGMINSMFEYTGGAHGVYASICNTYDFTTNNIVAFDDMFSGNYEAFLIEQLNNEVKNQFELEEGENLTNKGFFEDTIPLTDNFCLKMRSILFIYNIYEIAPYVMGDIEVEISYIQLKDYIRIGGPIDRLMKKTLQD